MFLTLFILNQLLMPGQKPVAVFHTQPVQGIVLHDTHQTTGIVLHDSHQTTGITLHEEPATGIPLKAPVETPVAIWKF